MAKTDKFVSLIRESDIYPKVILDIGAFDCAETLSLSCAFQKARVCAFECVPRLISQCDAAIRHNPRCHLIPVALGEKTGLRRFNESVSPNQECGSILRPNGDYFEPMPTRSIVVSMVAFADGVENITGRPDVMWIDVQGYELEVFAGMQKHIQDVSMIWTEVTYKPYYSGQKCVAEYDAVMVGYGFEKIHEEVGIEGWFGNACYRRRIDQ